ncbi:hypothetical protein IscW_ISCW004298 [Ixodes scapularis]|uniref:Uncharacterized protein n=1 Tax=Ixodes scapularis TaxID=6945 RepID=B7PG52_IXOSC|nr:hypothetical protein IscW_ISCW004298 [Ixodes scapularis]|eukprot:XP_002434174.1 hypothetical protein IscW_ISCW004298 [Ixodes scapularis]
MFYPVVKRLISPLQINCKKVNVYLRYRCDFLSYDICAIKKWERKTTFLQRQLCGKIQVKLHGHPSHFQCRHRLHYRFQPLQPPLSL